MSFAAYGLSHPILSQILATGYTAPTLIQERSIPVILEGKDVMGLAQTGSGKTAAFALPLIQRLLASPTGYVRGLILAPTRELVDQIHATLDLFAKKTPISTTCIYGGVPINRQLKALQKKPDILVACPGRLLDHLSQRTIHLAHVQCLILDEADQMFDMGFLPDIRKILRYVPSKRQTLLFSATMPSDIKRLAQDILIEPVVIEAQHTQPVDSITHTIFPVKSHLKTDLLVAILNQIQTKSVLIFTKTKHRAKSLDKKLQKLGYSVTSLQGNMSQNQRQNAINGFRNGDFLILVATDIAARGIDISRVSHVINYDLPDTSDAYTHRIGRTGRASRTGDAYVFVTHEDRDMLRSIEKKLGKPMANRYLENFNYDAPPNLDQKNEFARPRQPKPYASHRKKYRS